MPGLMQAARLGFLMLSPLAVVAFAASASCSSSDSAPDPQTGADAATDGGSDADIVPGEAGKESGPPACVCKPDYCGCGPCAPADIVCSQEAPVCTQTCSKTCPSLATAACKCLAGRCIRQDSDAGASSCYSDKDCPPAQCCAKGTAARGVCTSGVGGCQ